MERHTTPLPTRPEAGRARAWPSPNATPVTKINDNAHKAELDLLSIDEHPEEHFLSPVQMYEYDDWTSDSDSDDDAADEVEWSAGITDFALFDSDRRQASVSGQAMLEKWGNMLSSQASALGRAVERQRQDTTHSHLSMTPSTESMPDLTPDGSPQLFDDLEVGSYRGETATQPIIPEYLRSVTSAPSLFPRTGNSRDDNGDEEELSFYVQPRRTQSSSQIAVHAKPRRPGLCDGRTLSGKEHVWRRPSWDIFTVREDAAAELKAETGSTPSQERGKAVVADFQRALSR